jgi:hypothetical protein
MVFMPNKSTPDYLFEKANQCFRRSRTDSNARVIEVDTGTVIKTADGNFVAVTGRAIGMFATTVQALDALDDEAPPFPMRLPGVDTVDGC